VDSCVRRNDKGCEIAAHRLAILAMTFPNRFLDFARNDPAPKFGKGLFGAGRGNWVPATDERGQGVLRENWKILLVYGCQQEKIQGKVK